MHRIISSTCWLFSLRYSILPWSLSISLCLSLSLCVSVSVSPSLSLSSLSLSCSICMFVHLCIFRTRYLFLSLHSISRSTSLFTSLSSYLNFSIFISHSFSLAVYTTSPFFSSSIFPRACINVISVHYKIGSIDIAQIAMSLQNPNIPTRWVFFLSFLDPVSLCNVCRMLFQEQNQVHIVNQW